jgi:hypothetical protein
MELEQQLKELMVQLKHEQHWATCTLWANLPLINNRLTHGAELRTAHRRITNQDAVVAELEAEWAALREANGLRVVPWWMCERSPALLLAKA